MKLGDQIAKFSALGEVHKRMMESADRLKALTEIRDRSEEVKNAAFDAAGAGKLRLEDLKGKLVVIQFWSTACPAITPELIAARTRIDKKTKAKLVTLPADLSPDPRYDMVIIGVNLDRSREDVEKYLSQHPEYKDWVHVFSGLSQDDPLARELDIYGLARLSPDHSVQEVLDTLRQRSAAWAAQARGGKDFSWHEEDVAVTISPMDLKTAREFIESQESHHEVVSFQCELKAIFDEYGFDYDERKLWS